MRRFTFMPIPIRWTVGTWAQKLALPPYRLDSVSLLGPFAVSMHAPNEGHVRFGNYQLIRR